MSDTRRWSIVLSPGGRYIVVPDINGHWHSRREALHRKVVVNKALAELEAEQPQDELTLTQPRTQG